MDSLIYDRLQSDVDMALNNPQSTTNLKGAYNYTDLNRVEEWCEYIQEQLNLYGAGLDLEFKKDWSMNDTLLLRRSQIDRIRKNVETLKDFCISVGGDIEYNDTLDYEQANVLEKILYDIYIMLAEMNIKINANYRVGAITINKSYISLKVKDLEENITINGNYRIGLATINKDYIHLKNS